MLPPLSIHLRVLSIGGEKKTDHIKVIRDAIAPHDPGFPGLTVLQGTGIEAYVLPLINRQLGINASP